MLKHGTPLLASAGDEYSTHDEGDNDVGKMSEKERVSFYRQQLRQKLGLVAQGKVFSTGKFYRVRSEGHTGIYNCWDYTKACESINHQTSDLLSYRLSLFQFMNMSP